MTNNFYVGSKNENLSNKKTRWKTSVHSLLHGVVCILHDGITSLPSSPKDFLDVLPREEILEWIRIIFFMHHLSMFKNVPQFCDIKMS